MDDCTIWHVDKSKYHQVYYDAINRAPAELPENVYEQLSVPEAWPLTHEYVNAESRVLIMGQESYTNWSPIRNTGRFDAWSAQIGSAATFDFARDSDDNQDKGPFWRAYQEIVDALGLSRRHTTWTNLCKVQLLEKIDNGYSVSQLSPEDRMAVVRWQRQLFRAEMEFTRPDAIVFLTGGMTWMLKHMYDDFHTREIGEGDEAFNVLTIKDLDIPMVQTYHPGARNVANVSGRRAAAVRHLKAELGIKEEPALTA